jgi:CTP synthase
MPDQYVSIAKGGTMRLGAYPCKIKDGTLMKKAYKANEISERHRHRYEFNNEYRKILEAQGLKISGTSPDDVIVETVEIPKNDFFVGVQFHPEFKSRPNRAHPLFALFIKNAVNKKAGK